MAQQNELPVNRLATTDSKGRRIYLYPADVRGVFRKIRTAVYSVLILIFLGLPWVHINGQQALLLDIPNRRFMIFGLTLWAHDAPILLFIFLGAALTLAFVTAIFGRVWCGWACPQTVFIDMVFRRIERWLEGDSFQRKRLDAEPMTLGKAMRRIIKWGFYLAASLVLTHSFLAYFVGAHEVIRMVQHHPGENWTSFLVMLFTTGIILFDFGWFREQFCVIACPYGRFQSVLMDQQSLAVLYDPIRGEPRRGTLGASHNGDCVNCYRCVQVCPTGIDIRRGVQLECVACTACIDACDEVMVRVNKPKGLIRYETEMGIQRKTPPGKKIFFSIRAGLYFAILLVIGAGLVFTIANRELMEFTFVRASEAPYILGAKTDKGQELVNHYHIDFRNQSAEDLKVRLEFPPDVVSSGVELVMPISPVHVPAGQQVRTDIFIKFTPAILTWGKANLPLNIVGVSEKSKRESRWPKSIHVVGPFQ